MVKHFIEDEVTREYDEAYFCQVLSRVLDALATNRIRDGRVAKIAR